MLLTLVYVLHQNMPFAIGKQILHEQKATHPRTPTPDTIMSALPTCILRTKESTEQPIGINKTITIASKSG